MSHQSLIILYAKIKTKSTIKERKSKKEFRHVKIERKTVICTPAVENVGSGVEQGVAEEVSTDNALTISRKPVKIVMLPKDIYAEFGSVIRTRYGNKIPKYGYVMLHNPIKRYNFFLLFNHDDHSDRNVCTCKLDLDRDADLINDYLERFD